MSVVDKSIEVEVPVRAAYDQWTRFEEFPRFMEGVEEVHQIDDTTLRWSVEIAGTKRSFETQITHQQPDELVCWTATEGQEHAGEVRFEALAPDRTRIVVRMSYDPHTFAEKLGDFLNIIDGRVQRDLNRFKQDIEGRGHETGGWRGRVEEGDVRADPKSALDTSIGSEGSTTEPARVEADPVHPTPGSLGDRGPTAGPAERR